MMKVMQIANPQGSMPVLFQGLGQNPVQEKVERAVAFANRAQTEVINPTVAKSRTQLISPVQELANELRRICGVGVGESMEVGKFLQVLDCWVTEAFGWWAQIEQVAIQTTNIGTAMLEAAAALRNPERLELIDPEFARQIRLMSSGEAEAFITQMTRTGLNQQTVGNTLAAQAASWKPVLRNVLLVSHTLRDIVVLFNDAVEQNALPDNAQTAALRESLEQTVTAWKGEIVNRVVDAAFATRLFALQQAKMNAELVRVGFNLAALAPQSLVIIADLKRRIDELADLLNIAALPGNALVGLGEMVSDAGGAIARGTANFLFDIMWKTALVAAGVAVVGTGVAVVLKKTGVIGQVKLRRHDK